MQSSSLSPLYRLPTFRPKFPTSQQNPPTPTQFHKPRMSSLSGFRVGSEKGLGGSSLTGDNEFYSLIEYVGKRGINVEDDLVVLLHHIQYACKKIAALVASPFNHSLGKQSGFGSSSGGGSDRDAPKPLDIVSVCYIITFMLIEYCVML